MTLKNFQQRTYRITFTLLILAGVLTVAGLQQIRMDPQVNKHWTTLWLSLPSLLGLLLLWRNHASSKLSLIAACVLGAGTLPSIIFGVAMMADSVQGEAFMVITVPWTIGAVSVGIALMFYAAGSVLRWRASRRVSATKIEL